jgi:hypothetical protein
MRHTKPRPDGHNGCVNDVRRAQEAAEKSHGKRGMDASESAGKTDLRQQGLRPEGRQGSQDPGPRVSVALQTWAPATTSHKRPRHKGPWCTKHLGPRGYEASKTSAQGALRQARARPCGPGGTQNHAQGPRRHTTARPWELRGAHDLSGRGQEKNTTSAQGAARHTGPRPKEP